MKKIFTTAAFALAACTMSVAQDATSEFKPAKGANNLELNFVPLNGKPIGMGIFKYRKFLSEKTAIRIGIGVSYSSSKEDKVFTSQMTTTHTTPWDTTKVSSVHKTTELGWQVRLGYEHHYTGTNRLSPYMGCELGVTGNTKKEVTPTGVDMSGKTDEVVVVTKKNENKGGWLNIEVNLITGFDCYITKHLYMGAEAGFGFGMKNYSKYTMTTAYPSSYVIPSGVADPGNPPAVTQGKEMNIAPSVNTAIRLGWIF